ncbi:MAG: universal stress protein [Chlorobi bacterium]|nr:universal stress protein [Chlorobiota bacterium]
MPTKIITIASLTYMRAQLLSAMLERNGIECFMTNINLLKEAPGGVKVNINKADLQRANEIFEDFRKAYGFKKQEAVEYMRSIRRILVPVDFSYHSENAAVYALQMAAQFKGDIKLINAYLDPLGSPSSYLESFTYQLNLDEIISEVETETEMSLESLSLRLKKIIKQRNIKGVDVSYELYKGNSVDVILNYAEEFKAGLIIMGTRGAELEGLKSLGSITAEIIRKARIPVIAVPKAYDAWEFDPPKRILYATNFDESDYSALRKLISLVKPFSSKIYCVHASLDNNASLGEMQMRKIKSYLFDTMDSFKLECGVLKTSDIYRGMQIFIDQHDIDVIAVTHHKRSFLFRLFEPSVTKKFLFQTKIPLLVFHAKPVAY